MPVVVIPVTKSCLLSTCCVPSVTDTLTSSLPAREWLWSVVLPKATQGQGFKLPAGSLAESFTQAFPVGARGLRAGRAQDRAGWAAPALQGLRGGLGLSLALVLLTPAPREKGCAAS